MTLTASGCIVRTLNGRSLNCRGATDRRILRQLPRLRRIHRPVRIRSAFGVSLRRRLRRPACALRSRPPYALRDRTFGASISKALAPRLTIPGGSSLAMMISFSRLGLQPLMSECIRLKFHRCDLFGASWRVSQPVVGNLMRDYVSKLVFLFKNVRGDIHNPHIQPKPATSAGTLFSVAFHWHWTRPNNRCFAVDILRWTEPNQFVESPFPNVIGKLG